MALIDTAAALLALYFVAAFFRGRRRAPWAGLVALTTNLYAALSFNYTVIATGAWALHPVEYVALTPCRFPWASCSPWSSATSGRRPAPRGKE